MIGERMKVVDSDQLQWDFKGGLPTYIARFSDNSYASTYKLDPFPCYAPNLELVGNVVSMVEARFPLTNPAHYFLFGFEEEGRTNGLADRWFDYQEDESTSWRGWMCLFGKRIPIHDSMIWYLVGHEYGHIAQWEIEDALGIENRRSLVTELDDQYMKDIRPGCTSEYGARKWHRAVGELIANDFRICVLNIAIDVWPHPGFAHPLECDSVQKFWSDLMASYYDRKTRPSGDGASEESK